MLSSLCYFLLLFWQISILQNLKVPWKKFFYLNKTWICKNNPGCSHCEKVSMMAWSSGVVEWQCHPYLTIPHAWRTVTCVRKEVLMKGKVRMMVFKYCGICVHCAKTIHKHKWAFALITFHIIQHTHGWCFTALCHDVSFSLSSCEWNSVASRNGCCVCGVNTMNIVCHFACENTTHRTSTNHYSNVLVFVKKEM